MVDLLLSSLSLLASIVGIGVAVKGTTRTQAILRTGNDKDPVIDAMAWADRKVLRTPAAKHVQVSEPA
jgi:hypothetical protein